MNFKESENREGQAKVGEFYKVPECTWISQDSLFCFMLLRLNRCRSPSVWQQGGRVVIPWRLVLYCIFVKFSVVPVMMSLIS